MAANSQTPPLLSDRQIQDFIRNGYVTVQTSLPDEFHASICRQTDALLGSEPNPGNNLLPRIPELSQMLADPAVHGALTSILGPGYLLDDHRYCHANQPGSEPQRMHQDGGSQGDHRTRKVLLLYYPQDTPERLGPTGVLPGSQYYRDRPQDVEMLALAGAAGTVTVTHYELWHGATANRAQRPRYMMKFLLHRMQEPEGPDWDTVDADWDTECSLWQSMWRWHRGEAAGGAAPLGNGASAAANGGAADLSALADPHVQHGMEAAYALAAQLCDALASDCTATVNRSVYALAALGTAAVTALSAALEHACAQVRAHAAQALAEMGGSTARAAPALRRALKDGDEQVRTWAATALGTCSGDDAEASIAALEATLDADLPDHGYRRQIAAQAIVRLAPRLDGAAAGKITGLLAPYLESRNRYLRGLAAEALRRLRTPAATELLLDWLTVARWCPITTPDSPF